MLLPLRDRPSAPCDAPGLETEPSVVVAPRGEHRRACARHRRWHGVVCIPPPPAGGRARPRRRQRLDRRRRRRRRRRRQQAQSRAAQWWWCCRCSQQRLHLDAEAGQHARLRLLEIRSRAQPRRRGLITAPGSSDDRADLGQCTMRGTRARAGAIESHGAAPTAVVGRCCQLTRTSTRHACAHR